MSSLNGSANDSRSGSVDEQIRRSMEHASGRHTASGTACTGAFPDGTSRELGRRRNCTFSKEPDIEIEAAEAHGIRTTYLETPARFTGLTPEKSAELHRAFTA